MHRRISVMSLFWKCTKFCVVVGSLCYAVADSERLNTGVTDGLTEEFLSYYVWNLLPAKPTFFWLSTTDISCLSQDVCKSAVRKSKPYVHRCSAVPGKTKRKRCKFFVSTRIKMFWSFVKRYFACENISSSVNCVHGALEIGSAPVWRELLTTMKEA